MRNFLLVCDNGSGEKITIGYRWPLWLDAVDGLTSSDFDVDTEKGNDQDGEHYKSSTAVKRNIVIYCWVKDNIQAMREKLYSYFPRGETGTLYVTGENLLTATKYLGLDPEFAYSSGNSAIQGFDYAKVMQPKSVKLGINLKF